MRDQHIIASIIHEQLSPVTTGGMRANLIYRDLILPSQLIEIQGFIIAVRKGTETRRVQALGRPESHGNVKSLIFLLDRVHQCGFLHRYNILRTINDDEIKLLNEIERLCYDIDVCNDPHLYVKITDYMTRMQLFDMDQPSYNLFTTFSYRHSLVEVLPPRIHFI